METKNESEKIFEQYLDSNGFQGKWNYEPSIPGKNKKIDYLLDFNSEKYFFEVKELRRKPNQTFGEAAWIDPYKSLRDEINEATLPEYFEGLVSHSINLWMKENG